ncbi:hypothetical protein BS47DRAFT_1358166 [Hydnum rufescens UP504]|uniref:Uncharacterized protein n=1 Tax=Hydnum rufescens UP504 TaxID=1448309 RepID=A0A9P6B8Q5_9AGAM|nr:hypothetical protein BS47DRAFT_1358166 [Hydnum rufescens UP504]
MTTQMGFTISFLAGGPLPITNGEIVASHLEATLDVDKGSKVMSSKSNTPNGVSPSNIKHEASESALSLHGSPKPESSDHGSEDKDAVFHTGHHSATQSGDQSLAFSSKHSALPSLNVVSNGSTRAIVWDNGVILTRSTWICGAR